MAVWGWRGRTFPSPGAEVTLSLLLAEVVDEFSSEVHCSVGKHTQWQELSISNFLYKIKELLDKH